jgi:hypothetical protein
MKHLTTLMFKSIDKKLKDDFKAAAAKNGKSMTTVITELMTKYVEETFGKK